MKLREEISKYKRGSDEESILKVLLGDCQQKAANNKLTEVSFQEIVRKMVKDNNETMLLLQDERKEKLVRENVVLERFLPRYLTEEEVLNYIQENNLSIDNSGKTVGVVLKHLKENDLLAEGKVVKNVITKILEK